MTIKTFITDGEGSNLKWELERRDERVGGIVYNERLKQFTTETKIFTSPTLGIDLNIDARFTGIPVEVHDGTDNIYWTASSIVGGKFTFDSIDRANTGTKSVKTNNASVGDTMQFLTGSSFDIGAFSAVTMFINVDKDWALGDSIILYGWGTGAGTQVGASVKLEDYFTEQFVDQWLKLSVPLSDMLLTGTIDAFRIEVDTRSGAGPIWYLDDFQIEDLSVDAIYTITPAKSTIFHLTRLTLVMADEFSGSVTNGTMPGIPYDSFLGVPKLEGGINFTARSQGETLFQTNFTQLSDLLDAGSELKDVISDGTNTYMKIIADLSITEFIQFDSRKDDQFSVTISDDLSGLLHFRVFANGKVEKI